ncbi:unnamed protein product [Effrenium voratum]|uniref:Uncharacterized protein n=1 Tax=Effrenium voratum TaxID=2562239 RepID=A0AA36IL37_9DINO|nr:unnamed protein product [Effrenium voratum]
MHAWLSNRCEHATMLFRSSFSWFLRALLERDSMAAPLAVWCFGESWRERTSSARRSPLAETRRCSVRGAKPSAARGCRLCSLAFALALGISGSAFARVNLWQKQWDASAKFKDFEKRKMREWAESGYHTGYVTNPRKGLQLGKDKENLAVDPEALDRLASEPLQLRLDRSGRSIKEGDKVEGQMPWSSYTSQGLHSAQAPAGWEDFEARYGRLDKKVASEVGKQGVQELETNMAVYDGKDEYRVIRTLTWPGGVNGDGPSSIMLIGVLDMSLRSERLTSRAIYEVEPTGLMVELCKERIGKQLIMPREHKEAVANYARGFATTNPHQHNFWLHHLDTIQADAEALNLWTKGRPYSEAVRDWVAQPPGSVPRTLCLGDVRSSTLQRLRREKGNETQVMDSTLSSRAKQLARGLISMASSGHKVILGIMDTDHLGPVTSWLERAGATLQAVADASDIESNRESLAADIRLGLQASKGPREAQIEAVKVAAQARHVLELDGQGPLGFFLNEEGLQFLKQRQERLLRLTRLRDLVQHVDPPKTWQTAEELYIVLPGDQIPGPESRLPGARPKGMRFEMNRLEIPDHYIREAGMEGYTESLWQGLLERGEASEPSDPVELSWWATGAIEAEFQEEVAYPNGW